MVISLTETHHEEFAASSLAEMRIREEDSKATRILKDQLRVLTNVHEANKKDQKKSSTQQAGMQIAKPCRASKEKRARPVNVARQAAEGLDELQSRPEMDELCTELANAPEFLPVLEGCAQNIDTLCARLMQVQPPATPQNGSIDKDRMKGETAQPEDSGGAQLQSKIEKLATEYIAKHVKFDQLEALAETVEKQTDYAGLRAAFPSTWKHHPNLVYLTKHTLADDQLYRQCIWATKQPASPLDFPTHPRFTRRASACSTITDGHGRGGGNRSRASTNSFDAGNHRGGTQHNNGWRGRAGSGTKANGTEGGPPLSGGAGGFSKAGMRRDRSAPALR